MSHRGASGAVAPLLRIESCEEPCATRVPKLTSSPVLKTPSKGLVGNSPFWIGPVMNLCLRSSCAATLFHVSRWRTWSRSACAPMLHRCGSHRCGIPVWVATCGVSLFAESAFLWSVNAGCLWSSRLGCALQPGSNPEHERNRDRDRSPVHGLLRVHWTRSILDRRPALRTTYARIHRRPEGQVGTKLAQWRYVQVLDSYK
jgi:hypothetical protein